MKKQQSGFTLIELMIVIAIIGILASVAIPSYQDYTVRARTGEALTALRPLQLSIAEYVQIEGEAPEVLNDLRNYGGESSASGYALGIVKSIDIAKLDTGETEDDGNGQQVAVLATRITITFWGSSDNGKPDVTIPSQLDAKTLSLEMKSVAGKVSYEITELGTNLDQQYWPKFG